MLIISNDVHIHLHTYNTRWNVGFIRNKDAFDLPYRQTASRIRRILSHNIESHDFQLRNSPNLPDIHTVHKSFQRFPRRLLLSSALPSDPALSFFPFIVAFAKIQPNPNHVPFSLNSSKWQNQHPSFPTQIPTILTPTQPSQTLPLQTHQLQMPSPD